MSDYPDNMIVEGYPSEMDLELLATTPKAVEFPPFHCYEMIQSGYPLPDHGEMICRTDSGTDEKGHLLPPSEKAMWVKRDDAMASLTEAKAEIERLAKAITEANGLISNHVDYGGGTVALMEWIKAVLADSKSKSEELTRLRQDQARLVEALRWVTAELIYDVGESRLKAVYLIAKEALASLTTESEGKK